MSIDARLRESAKRALGDVEATAPEMPRKRTDRFVIADIDRDAVIERISVDVKIDDRVEAVTLVLREGEIAWSCTDGVAGRESSGPPSSPFVRSALRWVSGGADGGVARASDPARSLRPAPAPIEGDAPGKLATALDDLVVAIARAGIASRDSPSVREGVERVLRAVTPIGPTVGRWIGRLERAMSGGDVRLVARLLDGAARAADDLRAPRSSVGARARASTWLGPRGDALLGAGEPVRLVDRAMIEVARETLDGVQRSAIERRYLVDLASGEVLREERTRIDPAPSLGPCPRWLAVGLAEVEEGPAPRRVRLLQYTVTLEVPEEEIERVHANAPRRMAMLIDAYRKAITAWPGLAEPVHVIAVSGIEDGVLVDAVGDPIPVARDEDPGAAAALDQATRAGDVEWIVGRLVDTEGAVRLVPCSFGRRGRVIRLR